MTDSSEATKRYPIDVRLFLLSVTVGMAISFGLGVVYGPVPYDDILQKTTPSMSQKSVGSASVPKRPATDHLADLGQIDSEGREHQPAGQHLLIDMKNIEADFLNSESRLADAMVKAVDAGGLTLLSYHCHSLIPAGVSCVGVLLESHISFHTWPDEGVITLDLFTCGDNPLIPIVPIIEKLFGIPRLNVPTQKEDLELFGVPHQDTELGKTGVVSLWSHELRGFRTREDREKHYLDLQSDLALWVTSPIDLHYKKEIVSIKTPYQQIDIWDTLEMTDTPSHEDGIRHNLTAGDPRWFTVELASPERILFLDGTLQSLANSEREYHEALVHPAMFAHPNPKNVAILGGGEGATLREVLKHTTIEKVTMIEIDEMMINIAREHLPKLNSCEDIVDSTKCCFDDPKTNLIVDDGHKWFVQNKISNKFDVIIMDALDPEDSNSDKLYTDKQFLDAAFSSLTEEGVIVIQVGSAPNIHDPKADVGVYKVREAMFRMIEAHPEAATMLVYEEAHCGFNEPHAFLVICKSNNCKERWYAATDVVDYEIYERIAKTKSGQRALVHYDGSTQHSYKFPPKAWETVYCRREPTPAECAYLGVPMDRGIFEYEEGENSAFEIKEDENGAYHVFASIDIPKGSFIMPSHMAASLIISERSLSNLKTSATFDISDEMSPVKIKKFVDYIETHGHKSLSEGSGSRLVEIGATTLIQSSNDIGSTNVGRWTPLGSEVTKIPVYSPVFARHRHSFDVFLVATEDITKGDELVKYGKLWTV